MTKEELLDEGYEKALTFEGYSVMQKQSCFQYGYATGAKPREKKIKELEKKNAELNRKLSDIAEVFISASKNDDCEMAHCGREIMEMLIEQGECKMTEEEKLAEKTVMSHSEEAIREQIPYFKFAEQMFLAGYKAGKDMNVSAKMHDLRKNPNDLPKEWQPVIAVTSYENYLILRFYPKTSLEEQCWRPLDDWDSRFTEIIAWWELPKYEVKL